MKLSGSLIKIALMAIVLTSVNAKVTGKERAIRDVPDDRDPGNLNTPAPTPPPTPAPTPPPTYPRDCNEIPETATIWRMSGVYKIQPLGVAEPFEVYCDFDADGGGWTVIQRRVDGSVSFDLGWNDYKFGFGDLETNFWLGNDKIYSLTKQKRYQLRIELTNWYGTQYYAKYSQFSISDESLHYKLFIGSYSGNAGRDSLEYHNGMSFSTRDADYDLSSGTNCAASYQCGWWFKSCRYSVLNGPYQTSLFYWSSLTGHSYLKFSEMKIRAL